MLALMSLIAFASWSCDSSVFSSGSSVSRSYICALRLLRCLHSKANALILCTALQAVSSLWSHTSCGVLGTVCSSRYDILY
jgi:hypothetical protein